MQAIPPPQRDYFQMVQLHSDGAGRIWAVNRMLDRYRKRLQNNWGTAGWWEVVLTALEGDRWLPAVKLASTAGRNDVRVAVPTAASDDLWLAWSRDGRSFRRVIPQQAQTWRTLLDNHVKQLVSIGFFTVPTIRFQIL